MIYEYFEVSTAVVMHLSIIINFVKTPSIFDACDRVNWSEQRSLAASTSDSLHTPLLYTYYYIYCIIIFYIHICTVL